jgi:hypothetical protein
VSPRWQSGDYSNGPFFLATRKTSEIWSEPSGGAALGLPYRT